jgi:endonuclease-3
VKASIAPGATLGRIARYLEREHGVPVPAVSAVAARRRGGSRRAFRVLVATMISPRTRDEVTEVAAERLLAAAPDPAALAALPASRIERLIYPAGFYHTKAANLRGAARMLLERHDGRVPAGMEELLELPGVGRKVANLVRNLGFGLDGICVDTHVHRISNRLGWVQTKTPEQTERALARRLPRRWWIDVNELLVRFGQTVCTPLSPRCSSCPLGRICPRVGVGRTR